MRIRSMIAATAVAALAAAPAALAQDQPPGQPPAEAAPASGKLEVGQPAPEISIDTWVNGEPFTLAAQKGNVVVVEFWATWCGPCRVSIPHIDEVYKKHKDKGLKVVGVSTEDLDTVKEFHAAQTAMSYHVGVDKDEQTSERYMEAVGATGIPHAFVIDQEGKLAWHGHPMDRLEQVVDALMNGTYDPAQAARVAELEKELQAVYESLASEADLPKMLPPIDKLIEADPGNEQHFDLKTRVLEAIGRNDEIPAVWVGFGDRNAENADNLVSAARRLSTSPDLGQLDVEAALRFSRKAVELTESKDADALAALARAEYAAGWPAKAVDTQAKATAIVKGTEGADAKEHEAAEAFYRKVAALSSSGKQEQASPEAK